MLTFQIRFRYEVIKDLGDNLASENRQIRSVIKSSPSGHNGAVSNFPSKPDGGVSISFRDVVIIWLAVLRKWRQRGVHVGEV